MGDQWGSDGNKWGAEDAQQPESTRKTIHVHQRTKALIGVQSITVL